MLDQFQAQDAPMHGVVALSEDTPLAHALARCVTQGPTYIAVKSGWDEVVGVISCDVLKRLAARVPEVPLKMLPMEQVRCVLATEPLSETVRILTEGDEQLLLVETGDRELLGALSRAELSQITDWAPLWAARKQRLGESYENLQPVPTVAVALR